MLAALAAGQRLDAVVHASFRYRQWPASRKIGVVAVARKLLIALWKYLEHGEVPAGARFDPLASQGQSACREEGSRMTAD